MKANGGRGGVTLHVTPATCGTCGQQTVAEASEHGGMVGYRTSNERHWWCDKTTGLRIDGKPATREELAALLAADKEGTMATTTETRYELRNVKRVRELSDETDCFAAAIYADGRRIGTAENHGQGGPNAYHIADRAEREAFEAAGLAWAAEEGIDFEPVESFVDVLLDDVENRRRAKRAAKQGFPVAGLVVVGADPLKSEAFFCAARDRAGVEQEAAKMGGRVRRCYDLTAGQ
jgi:hypothetical protein